MKYSSSLAATICSSTSMGALTASMAPGSAARELALSMHRARWFTSRNPSAGLKTPATHRATNSPRLWPAMAAGSAPRLMR